MIFRGTIRSTLHVEILVKLRNLCQHWDAESVDGALEAIEDFSRCPTLDTTIRGLEGHQLLERLSFASQVWTLPEDFLELQGVLEYTSIGKRDLVEHTEHDDDFHFRLPSNVHQRPAKPWSNAFTPTVLPTTQGK